MTIKNIVDIKVKTIRMSSPKKVDGKTRRAPFVNDDEGNQLIEHESFLRRSAYKNTIINVDESFFDDSDMESEYYLVVVYDANTNTPLLSSRYYFDKFTIEKYLKGDRSEDVDLIYFNQQFILSDYDDGTIFLADRLSGNMENRLYQQFRNQIFSLLHSEIAIQNKQCILLLMVRIEPENKQLSKYLSLGFTLIGSTIHKGKEHHIVIIDLKGI